MSDEELGTKVFLKYLAVQLKMLNDLEQQLRQQINSCQLQRQVVKSIVLSVKARTVDLYVEPDEIDNVLPYPGLKPDD